MNQQFNKEIQLKEAILDTMYPVGSYKIKYPWEGPMLSGGTWMDYTNRAVIYGLDTSPPPSHVNYDSIVGQTFSSPDSIPIVIYMRNGAGLLYQVKPLSSFPSPNQYFPYTIPEEFDPYYWEQILPVSRVLRDETGQSIFGVDFVVGQQLTTGPYTGRYIVEKITVGGAFFAFEGYNRPAFIVGGNSAPVEQGIKPDKIRNLIEKGTAPNGSMGIMTLTSAPPANTTVLDYTRILNIQPQLTSSGIVINSIDLSRKFLTDNEFQPRHFSIKLYRRIT